MEVDSSDRRKARGALALLAPLLALALFAAAPARAVAPTAASVVSEAAGLGAALAGSTQQARIRLAPEARALAKALPHLAGRVDSLGQPAATTEEQLGVALGEMRQMAAAAAGPHYTPALTALTRAYIAARGTDPLTGTAVNPEYSGLGPELAGSAAALHRQARRGAQLSRTVRALTARLSLERRRSAQLATALERLRNRDSRR